MKISCIQTFNAGTANRHPRFNGYVNGKYYDDFVIDTAKRNLNNSKWEQELNEKKITFLKEYLHAHGDDLMLRIIAGLVSFGSTEAIMALFCAIPAPTDLTKKRINQVKNCMLDLQLERKNKSCDDI